MPDDDPSPDETFFDIDVTLAEPAWLRALPDASMRARRAVEAALAAERARLPRTRALSVGIVLADDAFVRTLNKEHRGRNAATNVLSFPVAEHFPFPAREMALGDIVLAFETIAAEAAAGGLLLADHMTHLLIHGVLHLLGFTHEEERAASLMEATEAKILRGLGVAAHAEALGA